MASPYSDSSPDQGRGDRAGFAYECRPVDDDGRDGDDAGDYRDDEGDDLDPEGIDIDPSLVEHALESEYKVCALEEKEQKLVGITKNLQEDMLRSQRELNELMRKLQTIGAAAAPAQPVAAAPVVKSEQGQARAKTTGVSQRLHSQQEMISWDIEVLNKKISEMPVSRGGTGPGAVNTRKPAANGQGKASQMGGPGKRST